ncbi:hypothetical protein BJ138DRAFT_1152037 [Hygrophoropsis aurantiaca]|uniref:Uncharacterized protein n=1 Tax=Hygrophoropsis aurantiaca TaxID=72124 RepID=A0ACB8ABZ8_9AGAM|nr:hypothetical protein BJ138DRAFT_1152037 [Hygrophoropsis aurantiaca]
MISPETWHLNPSRCYIKTEEGKGRGVYASQTIPAHTIIELSPVLLFTKPEYESHGRYTLLDHYAFVWRDGRMALALGLGSLFNHSSSPNVSYTIEPTRDCIKYTTARVIARDEELCIFYGHNLWFQPVGTLQLDCTHEETDPNWGGLLMIDDDKDIAKEDVKVDVWVDGNPDDIVAEEDLPFTRIKLSLDEEEEQLDAIRTMQAWVVDILDSKHIAPMLKWLKQSGLDSPALAHLKRIRRKAGSTTLLVDTSSTIPSLPDRVALSVPYQIPVPCTSALTTSSLELKNTFWPTVYTPRRKWEPEKWTKGKVRWAYDAMRLVAVESAKAAAQGELPIVSHVPQPYEELESLPQSFVAHDSRTSSNHPLRHATLNIIRQVADYRASQPIGSPSHNAIPVPIENDEPYFANGDDSGTPRNGAHYLLTGQTLFTTHEPCIMCSMALLHSRVKEVFYLVPMPLTGGCGGLTCLPALKPVNHRFNIARWKIGEYGGLSPIPVDTSLDV